MNSVKGRLNVNNYRVWAYHGWYAEERVIGGEYQIDLELIYQLPAHTIDLTNTIDYQALIDIIDAVMKVEHKLIESSCSAIHSTIKDTFVVDTIKTTVTKLCVPINNLESTSFTLED